MAKSAISRFLELWAEIADLEATQELVAWDQETVMPKGGQAGRAALLGTLAGVKHRHLTASELTDAVARGLEECESDSVDERQLRRAQRLIDRATRIPAALARELAAVASNGVARWREARDQNSFEPFASALEHMVALRREEATALAIGDHLYDGLLDEYEPGMRTAVLEPLFESLGRNLTAAVSQARGSSVQIDETVATGDFSPEGQLAFGRWAAEDVGFDFSRGRLDPAIHPFCSGFGPGDVRITWRYDQHDFRPGLFGILHEAGHGMYEQGLPTTWQRTPLGPANSMGVHESQSRLWENHVGRHPGFWRYALPKFRQHFPNWSGTVDSLCPAFHKVEPTLIRVEADEVTYNLHILVRFRLELALLTDAMAIEDLPAAWDDAYDELLGVRAGDLKQGVLQDIHWASGLFGYFPTYTLGSLLSAQLFAASETDLGNHEEAFAKGEFEPLLGWLRDRIHRHGGYYSASELIKRASGRPLTTDAFLDYVDDKLGVFYGLSPYPRTESES